MKSVFKLAVVFALLATTAFADDRAPAKEADKFSGHEGKAWSIIHGGMLNHLSPHAASQLQYLVYHAVAKELCDGVDLDLEKAKAAVDKIHPENWDELSDADHRNWTNKYLLSYGAIFGIMLTEHADHEDEFCKGVSALIADKDKVKGTYFAVTAN